MPVESFASVSLTTRIRGRDPAAAATTSTAASEPRTDWFGYWFAALTQRCWRPSTSRNPSDPTTRTDAAAIAIPRRTPSRDANAAPASPTSAASDRITKTGVPICGSVSAAPFTNHATTTIPSATAKPRTRLGRSGWVRAHRINANAPRPTRAIGAAVAFMKR